jgi:phospholipase A1/A2
MVINRHASDSRLSVRGRTFSIYAMNALLRWLALAIIALPSSVFCATDGGVVFSLVAPAAVEPGATIEMQVAALNQSAADFSLRLPTTLTAAVVSAGKRSEITLQSRDAAPANSQAIAPGAFDLRTYTLTIPRHALAGVAMLEVQLPNGGATRTALEIAPAPVASRDGNAASTQRPTTTLARAQPAAAALRSIFADRLAPHEPTYFVYGPDDPAVKFQLSFKYKLLDFREVAPQQMVRTLHFAFTQRSLWDIEGESSPFYDTSYMPEVMYQSLAPAPEASGRFFTWLGFQAAFKHESNGRAGPTSRSLNVVYARPVFAIGRVDGWHLLAMPEVFTYVTSNDENADIEDYRGYAKLHLVLGRNDGPSLSTMLWAGKAFDHVSAQLDLTLPVRTRLLNFETYFLVQYFNGYGESLLSYRDHTETVRAGISLVR